jgi:hypothetical protein
VSKTETDIPTATKAPAKQFYIETYGCQMNEYDSLLAGKILESNATQTASAAEADIILLNTCAIRENAHQKVYNRLRELSRFHKAGAKVGILGCMAQNLREDLLYENLPVDFIMGPDALRNLATLVDSPTADAGRSFLNLSRIETYDDIVPTFEHHMRYRDSKITASVTIQRGCDNFARSALCLTRAAENVHARLTASSQRCRRWPKAASKLSFCSARMLTRTITKSQVHRSDRSAARAHDDSTYLLFIAPPERFSC